MKKNLSLIVAFIGFFVSINAQVFNLTTGTGAIGSNDPIWTLQLPSGGGFNPVPISSGSLESQGGTVYPNAYAHNDCGRWISPWINGSNNIISVPGTSGTFTYRMQFTVDPCITNPTALLNFTFMAADNQLTAVRVNGVAQTIPAGITHLVSGSMTSSPAVTSGLNTIEVDVYNQSSYTALQLCGSITVSGNAGNPPRDLDCCEALSGEVLSWAPVAGAIGYDVVISWNDPDCCHSTDLPYESIYSVTNNVFILPNPTVCHSWKVRAILPGGCFTEFSEKQCGCYPISTCAPPKGLKCSIQENNFLLSWLSVVGTGYELELIYNDPACCSNMLHPYTSILTTATNSIIIPNSSSCFSWRVRTLCEDGTKSDWSLAKCSCNTALPKADASGNNEVERVSEVFIHMDPNPASDVVLIDIENPTETLTSNNCDLLIVDLSGKVIIQTTIKLDETKRIDVSSLKSGMYICKISGDGKVVASEKLVIQ